MAPRGGAGEKGEDLLKRVLSWSFPTVLERGGQPPWSAVPGELKVVPVAAGVPSLYEYVQTFRPLLLHEVAAQLEKGWGEHKADAFEAVATEVVQDNLTSANATRLFFKSALCSLVGGEHDLMRGKVEIFAKRDPVFGASPEKLFLVDANRCATAEGLPDYDTFADAAYNFCTVRSLDAWDLSMLKVLNDDMRVKYDAYWSRVKRRAAREKRRAQKRKEEEERQARMKRDEARKKKDKEEVRKREEKEEIRK